MIRFSMYCTAVVVYTITSWACAVLLLRLGRKMYG